RLRVGAMMPVIGGRRWKLAGAVAPTLRGTETGISRMTDLGVDLAAVGGYYTRPWFAAGARGFAWELAPHPPRPRVRRRRAGLRLGVDHPRGPRRSVPRPHLRGCPRRLVREPGRQ